MRAVDAPRHPFFHQEALQVGRVVAQVDRWYLDGDQRAVLAIGGQIDVAAAAGMDFSDDPVAVESHPRVQKRRAAAILRLPEDVARCAAGSSSMRTI